MDKYIIIVGNNPIKKSNSYILFGILFMKGVNRCMNYYEEIKNELIDVVVYTRVKEYSKNKYTLDKYYNVGKLLIEAQGGEDRNEYGNELIKEYSKRLTTELGKGYSWRNLYNMRLFYIKVNYP